MMNQVYKTLPDDRPITSLCVVEDVEKCPKGFVAVSRTHDQDSDADLWRENTFFGKKCTRYICLSKTEGTLDNVLQAVAIINEKETPPEGFNAVLKTFDSSQRAWRKRQLCYKFGHISSSPNAVTDIIVLTRTKKAPEEFTLCGDINGMTLCYKMGKSTLSNGISVYPPMPYSLAPAGRTALPGMTTPNYQNLSPAPPLPVISRSPNLENGSHKGIPGTESPHDYEMLTPLTPVRPAPKPPTTSYATMAGYNSLEGVPFVLNQKWSWSSGEPNLKSILAQKRKTKAQIDLEYSYDFRTERET